MKKHLTNYKLSRGLTSGEDGAIVLPAILWWLGVPFTLLIALWLFGIL